MCIYLGRVHRFETYPCPECINVCECGVCLSCGNNTEWREVTNSTLYDNDGDVIMEDVDNMDGYDTEVLDSDDE